MAKKEAKEKRVDDIIDAAVDVFIEKGYENASMNEIAARAGISKGGLYHHFISKDMVLLCATEKLTKPCDEMMIVAQNHPSAIEGLKYYIDQYLKYWTERKREFIFFSLSMTKAMTHMDIFKMYEKYTQTYIESFVSLYQKGIEAGEFIPHNTRASSVALMSAIDGVVVYLTLDKKLKLDDIVKYYEEVFIKPYVNVGL